ncbi:alkaline phosphatase-like [Ptychodera flava]|uniref:alkaline phosphatase-like n=1 Tax=Ptychodera flava TaxID=63121 RepID=UPI00396A7025
MVTFHNVQFLTVLLFRFACLSLSQDAAHWNKVARDDLERALELETVNKNTAKNVIVFLGDGMGVPTITSARIYKGQLDGQSGEETSLTFESLPRTALIKNYNTDQQVPDSSGTATAILTGVKTKHGVVGVDDSVITGDCSSGKTAEVDSVFDIAIREGKAAGIVTTTRITHASPASVYAHAADRDWELAAEDDCVDIAAQLVARAADFQVVLGGGRRAFLTTEMVDPEDNSTYGEREDGRDLISEWKDNVPDGMNGHYVWNKTEFDAIDPEKTDYLFGLFEWNHMNYEANRADDKAGEPSLLEMTEKAIKMLSKNEKGFFLFVEGGRIDHAHHFNWAYGALNDAVMFDSAVEKALGMVDTDEDTLLIVTADHSHVNTISGYPKRGNPILGKTGELADDGLPYTTLNYANGPLAPRVQESFQQTGDRPNITDVDTESRDYQQDALIAFEMETHGGEDVTVHADGPYAHLFHNFHEQNYIAHVIKYAACIGEYAGRCIVEDVSSASREAVSQIASLVTMCVALLFNIRL